MDDNSYKMYTFIRGYCEARKLYNSLLALPYARLMHEGEKRKSGEDYLIHPLGVASYGISIGLNTDEIIATALLHDVIEDTTSNLNDLNVSNEIKKNVQLLTFKRNLLLTKKEALQCYYDAIKESEVATFVKLLDRYNNLFSMAQVFTLPKIIEYTKETEDFIYPLISEAKKRYPLRREELNILKINITSLINSVEGMLEFIPESERTRIRNEKTSKIAS